MKNFTPYFKHTLFLFFTLLFAFSSHGQAPAIEWQNTTRGGDSDELQSIGQTKPIAIFLLNYDVLDKSIIESSILSKSAKVIVLKEDAKIDKIMQDLQGIAENQKIQSISIFSHGAPGLFKIGDETITVDNPSSRFFYHLNDILGNDGSLQIFSCEAGSGIKGKELYNRFAEFGPFKVAMSNDITGFGGNWNLEMKEGEIESQVSLDVLENKYFHKLQTASLPGYAVSVLANLPSVGTGIAADYAGNRLFVAQRNTNGSLYSIPISTGVVTSFAPWFAVGFYPYIGTDLEFLENNIYFPSNNNPSPDLNVTDVSGLTPLPLSTLINPLPTNPGNEGGIGRTPSGTIVYTPRSGSNTLYEYNPTTGLFTLLSSAVPGTSYHSIEVAENTGQIFFAGLGTPIFEFDGTTFNPKGGSASYRFAVDADGDYAYTSAGSNIVRIDLNTGVVVSFGAGYSNGHGLTFGPASSGNGSSLYVINNNQVIEISGSFPTPIQTLVTWTGTTSTAWNTATNWSSGSVPSASDEIVIPDVSGASGNFPVTSADITVADLTVEAGATLTIGAGNGLIIGASGSVTNNGTLTLEADATGTAWLDDFTNASTTFTGTITAQQYVVTGAALGQRMFGSPVNNGVVQGLDQTYASGSTGQIVMSTCGGNVDIGSPYNNLFEWNEAAVSPNNCEYEAWFARSQSTPLDNGRGYSGWMNSGSTISFTGTPNTGNVSFGSGGLDNSSTGLPNKDGWHVLSNPYPSSANVNSLTGAGWQSPQTYDASASFAGTFQPINPGDDLGVAQGFVAKTNSANTANFTNAMRTQGSNQFKSNNDWFDAKLDIEVSNGTNQDITYIYFNNDASQAFDNQWDCEKRDSDNGIPTLYTSTTGMHTSLNGNNIAELGDYSFPMGLKPGSNGAFTFTVEGLNTLPASTLVFLEDKATGTWTNLRETNTYTFNMTTQEAVDRFEVHFTKPIAFTFEAESCEGNDGSITVDFGNQSINGNLQSWNYELRVNNNVIESASEADMLELVDLEPGDYEVTFTNGSVQVTEWVTIQDKVEVVALFDSPLVEVYVGDEITLPNASVGANAYTWEVNNETFNTTDLTYTFLTAGNYAVSLFAENADCEATTEQTIEVLNKTTGIAEQVALDNILVYSKNNSIVIDISQADLDGQTDLEVYNTLGQLIKQKLDIRTIEKIEMANQARGYYFVNIINQQEQVSKKVIIK